MQAAQVQLHGSWRVGHRYFDRAHPFAGVSRYVALPAPHARAARPAELGGHLDAFKRGAQVVSCRLDYYTGADASLDAATKAALLERSRAFRLSVGVPAVCPEVGR